MAIMHDHTLNITILHADEDRPYVDEMRLHLVALTRDGALSTWSRDDIPAGADHAAELDNAVRGAHVGLIFVSSSLWASHNLALLKAAEQLAARDNSSSCRVFVVHVLPCEYTPYFGQLRVFPADKIALGRHGPVDRASRWLEILEQMRTILTERQRIHDFAKHRRDLPRRFQPVRLIRDIGALSWWEVRDQQEGTELLLCSIQNATSDALAQLNHIRAAIAEHHLSPVWPFEIIPGRHGHVCLVAPRPAKSMFEQLCDCRIGVGATARIVLRLARGLSLLHARGFAIGSISPSSIFLDSHGRYYVSLFESVSAIIGWHEFLTFADMHFVAPELQGHGHLKQLTPAADVFSLGKLILRMSGASGGSTSPRDTLRTLTSRATSVDRD